MEFLQGQDITINLTLKDSEGEEINPALLEDLRVFVYAEIQGQKLLKVTLKKEDIEVTDNVLKVIIPRKYTANAPAEKHYLEVKIQQAGEGYEDGLFTLGKTDLFIGKIVKSANPKSLI
jgi:hypothetical protein